MFAVWGLPLGAQAAQWNDTLPKSGEYVPVPEPGTQPEARDFDTINVVPENEDGSPTGSGLTVENAEDSHAAGVDVENRTPVGRTVMWWLVGIVLLIVAGLVTAPFWLKRFLGKVNQ